jgi:lipopolysaccharide export system protein LptA
MTNHMRPLPQRFGIANRPWRGALGVVMTAGLLWAVPLGMAWAQTGVSFGGLKADTTLPVEVKAETLTVDNADGSAVFSGDVIVGQGDMRLSAGQVRVEYGADGKGIKTLHATGGVTLTNGTDAAEAASAVYTIDTGTVVMTGDVLLTQGQTVLSAGKLTINLKTGTGVLDGGVRTTFVPGGNE